MFYGNIDVPVRSSTKFFVIFGLVLLLGGMGYSMYLAYKERNPSAPEQVEKIPLSSQRAVDDCTYSRPCAGSTSTVRVPAGKQACFDPPIWSNLRGFGMIVSSQGVPEHRYECTIEDVASGVCKEQPAETFRFTPASGVTPPRHWFGSIDAKQVCSS